MKTHLSTFLLFSAALLPSLHATTIWHGDPHNSHYSIITDSDVGIGIEGDWFNVGSSISLTGSGGGFVTWDIATSYTFYLLPDAGWEFTTFNGAATDRGSWRNTYPGGHGLYTDISVGDLSFSEYYENPHWGSGGSFTIKPYTPWLQTYVIDGSDAHGLTVKLDQHLYVANGSFFGTDVGFDFSLQRSTYVPPAPGVPETGPTLGLLGLAMGALVVARRKFGAVQTESIVPVAQ